VLARKKGGRDNRGLDENGANPAAAQLSFFLRKFLHFSQQGGRTMKGGRPARQDELDRALRRMIYNLMVTSQAVVSLAEFTDPRKDAMKIAALIMARNLNDFLFETKYSKDDDINVADYGLAWSPDINAKLSWTPPGAKVLGDKNRIDKIVGHVVASKMTVFGDDNEVRKLVIPLIKETFGFICAALGEGKAKYTGLAPAYCRRLNKLLPHFSLPHLP
jgi:hypothetical protein